jgi:bifunctional non-homologous end joining protein LigD
MSTIFVPMPWKTPTTTAPATVTRLAQLNRRPLVLDGNPSAQPSSLPDLLGGGIAAMCGSGGGTMSAGDFLRGRPGALHSGKFEQDALCVWCFDLLQHNSRDLRALPLVARKTKLGELLARTHGDWLRYSDVFTDAKKLLAACDAHQLEGIVSKKTDAPYRSGKGNWIKVKCRSWREANRDRGDLFQPHKSR